LALTTQEQGCGIRVYYKRYEAVLAAQLKYEKIRKLGDWDALFMPTQNDFYQLVTSRSMWYKHYKLFEQMPRYPQLIDWLKESDNAQSNIEIWGFDCEGKGAEEEENS